jgi:cytosine/adenosine deaminase-related metal-dependent hydrolase
MLDPNTWIASPAIVIEGGRIIDVQAGPHCRIKGKVVDHGHGVIMPGLINAHTHLSLSALFQGLSWERGFIPWVKALIEGRALLDHGRALSAASEAAGMLFKSGVSAVGEFGPHIAVEEALGTSKLHARVWLEFLGEALDLPPLPQDRERIFWAYAAHAPHTVSPDGLCRIKALDRTMGRIFCLHLSESREECIFLQQGAGPWAQFLSDMGVDFSGWGLPAGSPVAYAGRLGLLDSKTLAVHLTQADEVDLSLLAETGTRICACPRSNWNLHKALPPLEDMAALGLEPALGTDSLASVESLDLFDEMAFVASRYPGLTPEWILSTATLWGAKALELPLHGAIRPGLNGDLVFAAMEAASPKEAALRLVNRDFERLIRLGDGTEEKEETGGL